MKRLREEDANQGHRNEAVLSLLPNDIVQYMLIIYHDIAETSLFSVYWLWKLLFDWIEDKDIAFMLRSVPRLYALDLQDESRLRYCFRIERLNLCWNNIITNEGIKGLIYLKNLGLCHNKQITDEGIKGLSNLKKLTLSYNVGITNEVIKGLSNLKKLNLSYNVRITDEGIKGLSNLTVLDLCSNDNITDEGIKGLTNLKKLNICDSRRVLMKEKLPNFKFDDGD